MAIGGPEDGRPAGRARRDPAAQRRTGRSAFLPREEGRQAGEESRATGCGSRTNVGQIRPLRGRARLVCCTGDWRSATPEPRGPVTPVVGIMSPMSTQSFSHEGFAQAPSLKRLLQLPPFDQFKPGRRPPAGRTPEAPGEPQLAHGDSARDHGQGGSLDRLGPAARFAGDAQQQPVPPRGLHHNEARRSRRPKRSVHLEPELERSRRNRSLGLISIVGIGDARHPMPALASEPIRRPDCRPVSPRAEDRTGVHQDRMITERTVAPHHQASPDLGH